jgi:hypothetical protein
MNTFAEIENGEIVNVSVWVGEAPQGEQFVEITNIPNVGIGWSYVNGEFIEPAEPEPKPEPETTLPESDPPNIEAQ